MEIRSLPLFNINDTSLIAKWKLPEKKIYSAVDIPSFQRSKALMNINGIIFLICDKISLTDVPNNALNEKIVDFDHNISNQNINNTINKLPPKFNNVLLKKNDFSSITISILYILDSFSKLKDETPPFPGPRRYGNLACRDWHDKLKVNIDKIIDDALINIIQNFEESKNYLKFKEEIKYYLLGSVGSRERLDYGTGHELSFISFLGCLVMIDLIDRNKMKGNEWLFILARYYDLIKSLILTYTLEPAGSHGVWGLDDHFHLIYVFGACQLIDFQSLEQNNIKNTTTTINKNNKKYNLNTSESRSKVLNYRMGLTPSSILNPDTLRKERCKNLYYNAISFIKVVKRGAFNEHSPILYEVSASKNWEKVAKGMLRMYYGEVLSKFPVVQHFYFGGVFYPWTDLNGFELPSSENQNSNSYENKNDIIFKNFSNNLNKFNNNKNCNNNRYTNEINSTMTSLYPNRKEKLSKLLQDRQKFSAIGKNIHNVSSKPINNNEIQVDEQINDRSYTTNVPWRNNNEDRDTRK